MKKALVYICGLMLLVAACKKDDSVSKVVEVSAPEITLKGDKVVSINVGGSYDDPGATVFDDITNSTTEITATYSSLNTAVPGLYYMQYTAKNANGYIFSVARYIAVTNYADDVDLSGVYERTSNGVQVELSRVARGLYKTSDMGGAGLPDVAYLAVIDENTIDFGPQYSESIGAEVYGTDAELTIGPEDTSYSYVVHAAGYGTALRTFVKVE